MKKQTRKQRIEENEPFNIKVESDYDKLLKIVPSNFFGPCDPPGMVIAFVAAQQHVSMVLKEFISGLSKGDIQNLLLQLSVRVLRDDKPRSLLVKPWINWQPISSAPHNKFILVACESGKISLNWIYLVARYEDGYHDRWDDESNDALMDGGYKPYYWSPLPNEPPPRLLKPEELANE